MEDQADMAAQAAVTFADAIADQVLSGFHVDIIWVPASAAQPGHCSKATDTPPDFQHIACASHIKAVQGQKAWTLQH